MSNDKNNNLIEELKRAQDNIISIHNKLKEIQNNQNSIEIKKLKQTVMDLERVEYDSLPWYIKCVRFILDLKYIVVTSTDKSIIKAIDANKNTFYDIDQNLINIANQSQPLARILTQEIDRSLDNLSAQKNLTPTQIQKFIQINEKFNKWATSQQSIKIFKHKNVTSGDYLENQYSELRQIQNNITQFLEQNKQVTELAALAREVQEIKETVPSTFFEKLNAVWSKVVSLFKDDSITKLLKNTEQNTEKFASIQQKMERVEHNLKKAINLDLELTQNKIDKLKNKLGKTSKSSSNAAIYDHSFVSASEQLNSSARYANTENSNISTLSEPTNILNSSLSSNSKVQKSINSIHSSYNSTLNSDSNQDLNISATIQNTTDLEQKAVSPNIQPQQLSKDLVQTDNTPPKSELIDSSIAKTESLEGLRNDAIVYNNATTIQSNIPAPPPLPPMPSSLAQNISIPSPSSTSQKVQDNQNITDTIDSRSALLKAIRDGIELKKTEGVNDESGPKIDYNNKSKDSTFNNSLSNSPALKNAMNSINLESDNLRKVLSTRNKAIHGEDNSVDEDWGTDDTSTTISSPVQNKNVDAKNSFSTKVRENQKNNNKNPSSKSY